MAIFLGGGGAESTKNRNRKSPQFSVANVLVASQTAAGTLFSSKKRKKNRKLLAIFVARKHRKALWGRGGERHFWCPKKSLRFFHQRQKIAIAIAAKTRHLVHSGGVPKPGYLVVCNFCVEALFCARFFSCALLRTCVCALLRVSASDCV